MRINYPLERDRTTGYLTVRGITTNLHPYAVEIADAKRAMSWAIVLVGGQFNRLCMGPYPPKVAPVAKL